jgi:hypothetical protein
VLQQRDGIYNILCAQIASVSFQEYGKCSRGTGILNALQLKGVLHSRF